MCSPNAQTAHDVAETTLAVSRQVAVIVQKLDLAAAVVAGDDQQVHHAEAGGGVRPVDQCADVPGGRGAAQARLRELEEDLVACSPEEAKVAPACGVEVEEARCGGSLRSVCHGGPPGRTWIARTWPLTAFVGTSSAHHGDRHPGD